MAVCALWPETTWELASSVSSLCTVVSAHTDPHATTQPRESSSRHSRDSLTGAHTLQPLQRRTLPPHRYTRERPARGRRETSCHVRRVRSDGRRLSFGFLVFRRRGTGHTNSKLRHPRRDTSDTGTRAETDALFLWCGFMTCLAWPALASAQRPPAPCAARARSGGCRPPSRA